MYDGKQTMEKKIIKAKRNGEIDFLRFVFCIIIVIHHYNALWDFGLFYRGYIAVEFFFLLSGYYMASHAKEVLKKHNGKLEVGKETWVFIIRKVKSFYRYYLVAILLQIVIRFILINHINFKQLVIDIFQSIPTFSLTFFVLDYKTRALYVGSTWFLSVMLLCMIILYPLLLKSYDFSSRVLFPLLSLFLLGYLCHNYGSVVEFESWNGFCLEGIVRGIGEISGGATIFSVVEFLKESNADNPGVKRKSREGLVTVLKVTCYIVVFAFAITGSKARYNYTLHAYLFCVLGIIASFLDAGFRIKDSAVTRYLGRISVPIYIFHGVLR